MMAEHGEIGRAALALDEQLDRPPVNAPPASCATIGSIN